MNAVDLFAGPGGWDLAAADLGIDVVGLEIDPDTCATRAAAGLRTIRADVADYPIDRFHGVELVIASPVCPTFSRAGKKDGLRDLRRLRELIIRNQWASAHDEEWTDPRTPLVLVPLRWIDELRPRAVALEQVDTVLPLWAAYAVMLEGMGYSVRCDVVNAADFGVPQTRRRALLVARRDGHARMPRSTHGSRPVSMSEALGWPPSLVGFPRRNDRDDGNEYRARDWRPTTAPAFTLTEKARSWKRVVLNTGRDWKKGGSRDDAQTITLDRPAPTVTGIPSQWQWREPDLGEAVNVTIEECAAIQTFPVDYPWQGSRSSRFQQIGNAVPPVLARAVLSELIA